MSSQNIVKKLLARPENANANALKLPTKGYPFLSIFPPFTSKFALRPLYCRSPWTCLFGTHNVLKNPLVIFLLIERLSRHRLSRWPALRHRSTPFVKDQYICKSLLADAQGCARARRNISAYQHLYVDEISCNTLNVTPCSPQERHEWSHFPLVKACYMLHSWVRIQASTWAYLVASTECWLYKSNLEIDHLTMSTWGPRVRIHPEGLNKFSASTHY